MEDSYKALVEEVLSLSMCERRALAHKILRSLQTEEHATSANERYEFLKSIVEDVLDHKIDNSRHRLNVTGRMYIAYIMQQDGYSTAVIGKQMKRDHATVLHLLKQMNDMLSVPNFYKKELGDFDKISQLATEITDNEDESTIQSSDQ